MPKYKRKSTRHAATQQQGQTPVISIPPEGYPFPTAERAAPPRLSAFQPYKRPDAPLLLGGPSTFSQSGLLRPLPLEPGTPTQRTLPIRRSLRKPLQQRWFTGLGPSKIRRRLHFSPTVSNLRTTTEDVRFDTEPRPITRSLSTTLPVRKRARKGKRAKKSPKPITFSGLGPKSVTISFAKIGHPPSGLVKGSIPSIVIKAPRGAHLTSTDITPNRIWLALNEMETHYQMPGFEIFLHFFGNNPHLFSIVQINPELYHLVRNPARSRRTSRTRRSRTPQTPRTRLVVSSLLSLKK